MNKNILALGFAALVGFVTLTAFGAKTKEQQMQEINAAVSAKLDDLRSQKTAECDARVASTANTRYQEMVAAAAVPTTKAGIAAAKKKASVKKTTTTAGPKVEPLPQPTAPSSPVNPKAGKTSGEAAPVNTEAKQSKTAGEAPAPNTSAKKSKTSGGGN